MKQMAADFKTGLLSFMEDFRQVTVGNEPITGHSQFLRAADGAIKLVPGAVSATLFDREETIRASAVKSRPRAQAAFDVGPTATSHLADFEELDSSVTGTPSKQPRALRRSKTDATRGSKRSSWNPLAADSLDDQDWSSWDSTVDQSPRWIGTTANGDTTTVPEQQDENAPL